MYYECLNMYGGTKEEGFANEQRNLIWLFKNKILNKRRKKKKQVYNKSMSDFKSNRALLVSGFTCFSLVGNSNTFINGQYPGRDEVLDGT